MNYVAWALCALIIIFFIVDFIKVEKSISKDEE